MRDGLTETALRPSEGSSSVAFGGSRPIGLPARLPVEGIAHGELPPVFIVYDEVPVAYAAAPGGELRDGPTAGLRPTAGRRLTHGQLHGA